MSVYLRDVTEQDRELLFGWANNELVRRNSFSNKEISYEEHCKWFDNVMKREGYIQWILQEDNQAIGQVRLKLEKDVAELSYSISAEYRGKGYGKLMLELATQHVKEELPEVKKLIAKVKVDNEESLRVLEKNGYQVQLQQLELEI